jgi:cation diffusion facilitator family transporter
VALLIAWESSFRFFNPLQISFDQAMSVAAIGLAVNLVSAWLLRDGHHHAGAHHHGHEHDHNLRAAYLHVLADALTSLTAIFALLCGKVFGWAWMDPAMGIVGSLVIARWSYGLLRETSAVLLDGAVPVETTEQLRSALECHTDDLVSDLHVWHVAPGRLAVLAVVVSDEPRPTEHYRRLLGSVTELAHVTVEVVRCPDHGLEAA